MIMSSGYTLLYIVPSRGCTCLKCTNKTVKCTNKAIKMPISFL